MVSWFYVNSSNYVIISCKRQISWTNVESIITLTMQWIHFCSKFSWQLSASHGILDTATLISKQPYTLRCQIPLPGWSQSSGFSILYNLRCSPASIGGYQIAEAVTKLAPTVTRVERIDLTSHDTYRTSEWLKVSWHHKGNSLCKPYSENILYTEYSVKMICKVNNNIHSRCKH